MYSMGGSLPAQQVPLSLMYRQLVRYGFLSHRTITMPSFCRDNAILNAPLPPQTKATLSQIYLSDVNDL